MTWKFKLDTEFEIIIDGENERWKVSKESDLENGVVSFDTPFGRALLMGKREFAVKGEPKQKFHVISVSRGGQEHDLRNVDLFGLFHAIDRLESDDLDLSIPTPDLDEKDIQLAFEWLPRDHLPHVRGADPRKLILSDESAHKDYELGRVLSARAAEKAALEFYSRLGMRVEDESIKQLNSPHGGDWQRFDLTANERSVDVKNARRANKSPQSYVEHCVPSFKLDRGDNEVSIAGILSPYLLPKSILKLDRADEQSLDPIVYLGETTRTDLRSLRRMFEIPGLLSIQFHHGLRGERLLLPSWVYDLPQRQYRNRDLAMDNYQAQAVIVNSLRPLLSINILALNLAAGVRSQEAWQGARQQEWDKAFCGKVSSWRTGGTLSLPKLYLSILSNFVETLHSSGHDLDGFSPSSTYRRLVYLRPDSADGDQFPLLTYDPLKIIATLIDTLDTAWRECRDRLLKFRSFKLSNLNILMGCDEDASPRWQTIIAYCGGRLENGAKCGYTPLVMGELENCPECGRLICPECDYCGYKCSLGHERRNLRSLPTSPTEDPI